MLVDMTIHEVDLKDLSLAPEIATTSIAIMTELIMDEEAVGEELTTRENESKI